MRHQGRLSMSNCQQSLQMETLPRPTNSTIGHTHYSWCIIRQKEKTKQIEKEVKVLSKNPDDFKVNKSKKSNGIWK